MCLYCRRARSGVRRGFWQQEYVPGTNIHTQKNSLLRLEASGWAQLRSAVCTRLASAALPVQRDSE